MKCNEAGLELIKRFEGLKLKAYKCPAGTWTIGVGHTGDVEPGMTITEHQAEAILAYDVEVFERAIAAMVKVPLTENEFSALVAFVFNIGVGAFQGSTMLKLLNQGKKQQAAKQFARWNKAKGNVLPGLVARREAERELFLRS